MAEMLRRALSDPASQAVAWAVALVYILLFRIAVADLTLDGVSRPASLFVVGDWRDLAFRTRAPFQFEAVAVVEAPFLVWLVSPMNIAIGLALGLLTGFQIALVRIARHCAVSCGLKPAAGVLAAVPGLLAGSACCAPILFVLLGVQVTASLITLMGLLVPAAFVFLLVGLGLTLRFAARLCAEAPA